MSVAATQPRGDDARLARRGRGAFLFLGLVPVFLIAALLWTVDQFRYDGAWIDHTHEVLSSLAEVDNSVTRAESSARAFFVNPDRSRLEEFAQFRSDATRGVERLRQLVTDNPARETEIRQLRVTVESRLAFLDRNLQLVQAGTTIETLSASYGAQGRTLIADLNRQFAALRQEETALLAERTASRRRTNWVLFALCGCVMLVSIAIALRGDHMIRRYRNLRDQAESRLKTANEQLEEHVRQRTEQLERSNTDLRQFAFAASHDLNEPLRTIGIYTDLLHRRYLGHFGEDADKVIDFILRGVSRMDALLAGLRTYLHISTLPTNSAAEIELRSGVEAALQDLQAAVAEARATVTCGELPLVRMHAIHARQIFQNLIGNALKYRNANPPEISISSAANGRDWVIRVTDNGIGIDPRFQSQIFDLFKRLHSADQIPGTGLGLGICRTILHGYGGKIWVESEPGKGSTFSFTLPRSH